MWIFEMDTKVMPEPNLAELRVACLDDLPSAWRPAGGAVRPCDFEDETTLVIVDTDEDVFVEDDDAYVSLSIAG